MAPAAEKTCGCLSKDLFATKWSLFIFIMYMALFINQGIMVKASQAGQKNYKYNTIIAVLLTECVKIVASVLLYIKDAGLHTLLPEILKHSKVFFLYFVPAALYCAYNNLAFVNLANYDPTTYFLLMQFRVVITGVIFQILFKKKLSVIQWISLFVLTAGCILKEVGHTLNKGDLVLSSPDGAAATTHGPAGLLLKMFDVRLLLIMVQVLCSCFAGVYNEYLLKDTGAEVHIMIQNFYMYIDSIICGLLTLGLFNDSSKVFTLQEFSTVLTSSSAMFIVLNNAAIGIVTSLFLKSMNSILKNFASALELMFTAVLCWLIFGYPVDVYTIVSIFVVSGATFLYAQNPVVNLGKLDSNLGKASTTASHKV